MKLVFRILFVFLVMVLVACSAQATATTTPNNIAAPNKVTLIAPTVPPTATAVPVMNEVVTILNDNVQVDALRAMVEARYSVVDASLELNPQTQTYMVLHIKVECECMHGNCCSTERALYELVTAFKGKDVLSKVQVRIPPSIEYLVVHGLDHMTDKGVVGVFWKDLVDYINGPLTTPQFASRIRW